MQPHYAIFGGSFNPIHRGHVAVVEHLLQLGIDTIVVIPTSRSPFKQQEPLLPNALRLEMVRRTFQDWKRVVISDFEIKRRQITYTYHTLNHLYIQYPEVIWHLVLGWDTFQEFPKWRNAQQIITRISLWIVQRSGLSPQENKGPPLILTPRLTQWFPGIVWDPHHQSAYHQGREIVRYLEFDTPAISSTDIRSGQASVEWLPSPVRSLYTTYLTNL